MFKFIFNHLSNIYKCFGKPKEEKLRKEDEKIETRQEKIKK